MKNVHLCVIILILLCLPSLSLSDQGEWSRRADMPTRRGWFGTAMVNGKIYAIGGIRPPNITTVEEYDPQTDTWTKKADMPTRRDGLSVIAVNGKIYAIGGLLEDWDTVGPVLPTVEEYDPATDTWTKKADMPYPRSDFSISVVNGRIYIFGGGAHIPDWASLATVQEYDPVTDTWTRKADMPTPRSKLAENAPAVNGRIYVIGGTESYTSEVGVPTVEEYDPVADTWAKKADMPTPRLYLALSEVNGKIYAIGGERSGRVALQTVEEYDPVSDTWTGKPDMPTARLGFAASSIDGRIYAIGGWDQGVGLSTVEAYDTGVREGTVDTGPSLPWIHVVQPPPIEGSTMGGEPIAIFGEGFASVIDVTIGGNPLTRMEMTDTLITGLAPPGTEGEWAIVLHTPRSDYSVFAGKFIYKTPSDVVIERITPTNGRLAGGDRASITGSGFLPGATVTIGGNPATNVGITSSLISFTIPAGTEGAKDVVVTNPDGQRDTLYRAYTYNPFPVIERIRPPYGGPLSGGTEITITGSNFMEGAIVTIGENRGYQLALFSSTELRLRTPPGTVGPKAVRIVNPDGQEAVKEDGFTYNPAPTITSVSPNAGPLEGGTPITITGTGFIVSPSPISVLIGGAEASVRGRVLPTQVTAVTPPSDAGVKDVTVVNLDGQRVKLEDAFTYNDSPVITRVTPDNGRLAGGTRITVQGSSFLPGARVLIRIEGGNYREALSSEAMSSSVIVATTPPGSPGTKDVVVLNSDGQEVVLPEGYTYNPMPTITRLIPNHGPSSGGSTITVEGSGFLLGARVVIGERPATTMVRDDMTIEAVAPPNPQGVWDVRVINPDTQEVIKPGGFVSAGEVAYNYPNPFYASQGTTFRYVTKDTVYSVTVKIFNMRGRPIGAARQDGSDEVKWVDPDVYAGLYIYILEAELEGGKRKQVKNVMEVVE
jgi:N-acetylneuraminic acid mutarotase